MLKSVEISFFFKLYMFNHFFIPDILKYDTNDREFINIFPLFLVIILFAIC